MRRPARLVSLLTSVLSLAVAACSSSSSGTGAVDSGFGTGGEDSSTTKKDSGDGTKKDSGSTTVKDAGSTAPPGDAACGSSGGSDWCTKNAPMLTSSSNLFCDDFDEGVLSTIFNWPGVRATDLVNAHYVSPYCALNASSTSALQGAYSEHPYTLAPASAGATLAFDLFVPSGASCEGATVSRFYATTSQDGTDTDAIKVWLSLSDLVDAGDGASSYTVTMTALVGNSGDGGAAGTPSSPVALTVTPRSSDHGWARISIDLSSYALATPATVAGSFSWAYPGAKTAEATSTKISASGQLGTIGTDPQLEFDVGVVLDPMTETAVAGCSLYVDDFVSNIITQ